MTTLEPKISRPYIADPGYGMPKTLQGTLPWSHAVERLNKARNYWVSTTRPDGRPHAMPVWGVMVDDRLYFGGSGKTRRSRNLDQNPAVVVHLESGDDVIIVEGTTTKLDESNAEADLLKRIDEAYQEKYKMPHGTPVWAVKPLVVFAWTKFFDDATRWSFEE